MANLRTALHTLGRNLPQVFVATQNEVEVAQDSMRVDVWEIRNVFREAQTEPSQSNHIRLLTRVAEKMNSPILEGWKGDWVEQERERWLDTQLRTFLTVAGAEEESSNWDKAIQWYRLAFQIDPISEAAIAGLIRSHGHSKKPAEAEQDFSHYAKSLKKTIGLAPSEGLYRLFDSVRNGTYPPQFPGVKPTTPVERAAIVTAFERSLAKGGDAAAKFIAADPMVWLSHEDLIASRQIIERIWSRTQGVSDDRFVVGCCALLLALRFSDYERAEQLRANLEPMAEQVGESEHTIMLLSYIAFFYLEIREYDKSLEHSRRAVSKLSDQISPQTRSVILNGHASTLWHLLQFDTAKKMYASALDGLDSSPQNAYYRLLIRINLGFVAIVEEEFEELENIVEEMESDSPHMILFGQPRVAWLTVTGFLHSATGNDQGRKELAEAVLLAHRSSSRRWTLIALDHICLAFEYLRLGSSSPALESAVKSLRETLGHERSPAERLQIERTLKRLKLSGPDRTSSLLRGAHEEAVVKWAAATLIRE
ncbi:MAG: bacterial transcriptional activator domain-containing protein [Fimbriimonadaceae bacterium]|nr:bacterial transcriptional activator domain-containing protein [Fimbriimonadaceae bacterium]